MFACSLFNMTNLTLNRSQYISMAFNFMPPHLLALAGIRVFCMKGCRSANWTLTSWISLFVQLQKDPNYIIYVLLRLIPFNNSELDHESSGVFSKVRDVLVRSSQHGNNIRDFEVHAPHRSRSVIDSPKTTSTPTATTSGSSSPPRAK